MVGVINGNDISLVLTAGIFFAGSVFQARNAKASRNDLWKSNCEALEAQRDILLERVRELEATLRKTSPASDLSDS